jgi:hypothetical protein
MRLVVVLLVLHVGCKSSSQKAMEALCDAPRQEGETGVSYLRRVTAEAESSATDPKVKSTLGTLAMAPPEARAVFLCAAAVEAGLSTCRLADVWSREVLVGMERAPWPTEGTYLVFERPAWGTDATGIAKAQAVLDAAGLGGAHLVPLRCPDLANADPAFVIEIPTGDGAPDVEKVIAVASGELGMTLRERKSLRRGSIEGR